MPCDKENDKLPSGPSPGDKAGPRRPLARHMQDRRGLTVLLLPRPAPPGPPCPVWQSPWAPEVPENVDRATGPGWAAAFSRSRGSGLLCCRSLPSTALRTTQGRRKWSPATQGLGSGLNGAPFWALTIQLGHPPARALLTVGCSRHLCAQYLVPTTGSPFPSAH